LKAIIFLTREVYRIYSSSLEGIEDWTRDCLGLLVEGAIENQAY